MPLSFGTTQNNSNAEEVVGSTEEVVVEKFQTGLPHEGKVLAAIQSHCDDIPIFAGGTVAKLIIEGYTGSLIRTTNDDHAGQCSGILPHSVRERYYFARGPQLVNRIVDISNTIDQKVESNRVIVTQGPGGDAGVRLRDRLAKEGKSLPILEGSNESANRSYIKNIVLDMDSQRISP